MRLEEKLSEENYFKGGESHHLCEMHLINPGR